MRAREIIIAILLALSIAPSALATPSSGGGSVGAANLIPIAAPCDGMTDGSSVFSAAKSAAEGTGKALYVPQSASGCVVNTPIPDINGGNFSLVGSGCSVDGAGVAHGSIIKTNGTGNFLNLANGAGSTKVQGVTLADLCVVNTNASPAGIGLNSVAATQTVNGLTVRNVVFRNFATAINLTAVQSSRFDNLDLRGNTKGIVLGNGNFADTFTHVVIDNDPLGISDTNQSYDINFFGGSCEIQQPGLTGCVDIRKGLNINFAGWDMETDSTHMTSQPLLQFFGAAAGATEYNALYSNTIANNVVGNATPGVLIHNCTRCLVKGGAVTAATALAGMQVDAGSLSTQIDNVFSNVPLTDNGTSTTVLGVPSFNAAFDQTTTQAGSQDWQTGLFVDPSSWGLKDVTNTKFPVVVKANSPTNALVIAPTGTSTAGPLTPGGFLFANIGANLTANGQIGYCSDCTIANPCAGLGNGAIAKRLNGVNVCN